MSWTLTIDIPRTRRLRFHEIRNETGEQVAVHQDISKALKNLVDLDIRRVEVISPEGHYLIDIDTFPWAARD